jgi:hypothetical protein
MDVWRAKAAYDAQTFWLVAGFLLFLTPVGWLVLVIGWQLMASIVR